MLLEEKKAKTFWWNVKPLTNNKIQHFRSKCSWLSVFIGVFWWSIKASVCLYGGLELKTHKKLKTQGICSGPGCSLSGETNNKFLIFDQRSRALVSPLSVRPIGRYPSLIPIGWTITDLTFTRLKVLHQQPSRINLLFSAAGGQERLVWPIYHLPKIYQPALN